MTTDSTHNGDTSGPNPNDIVNEQKSAAQIMQDPAAAAAAGSNVIPLMPEPAVLTSPHITDPGVAALLNDLPGLVGAIDHAVKTTTGKVYPFMLMVFTPGIALHASNLNDKAALHTMVRELVATMEDPATPGGEAPIPPADTGGAANDAG